MSDARPSPKKFLAQAKEESNKTVNGKLRIYLGASPGVGKTFAMLRDAIIQQTDGFDVIIGVVESHGRGEIEVLSKQLEHIPLQEIIYHGKSLLEFNLEAAIARKPTLLLVDEMAHANVPGAKHKKRWQDIRELLENGINVATTLNVQHIESLNDSASQIIHSPIQETVPDFMIESADSIELVDLPPEDLLKRLAEGKVYLPEQAKLAQEHFFRRGNLLALRELALRLTASRVGKDVTHYREERDIQHIWATRDKWLVCIGPSLASARLIRTTYRIATGMQSEWMAIHVKDSQHELTPVEQQNVAYNLRLAKQLGAKIKILSSKNLAKEVIQLARKHNVTTIVVGKSHRPQWQQCFFPALANQLIKSSDEIDVRVIAGSKTVQSFISKRFPWSQMIITIIVIILLIVFIYAV
ncbi:MAG: sensor histidine kinase KdpD [Gammaproteobacteria bacterium]|nr:sensor histidine kinase KdpD [Gammaproteobacteria bacterium]